MTTKYLDRHEFESLNTKLTLVFSEGDQEWDIQLFFNEEDGKYYAKGPYGRWDAVCYVELGVKTDKEISEWISSIS